MDIRWSPRSCRKLPSAPMSFTEKIDVICMDLDLFYVTLYQFPKMASTFDSKKTAVACP
jgi:hypothetical protein